MNPEQFKPLRHAGAHCNWAGDVWAVLKERNAHTIERKCIYVTVGSRRRAESSNGTAFKIVLFFCDLKKKNNVRAMNPCFFVYVKEF